jgi:hypothetical protein
MVKMTHMINIISFPTVHLFSSNTRGKRGIRTTVFIRAMMVVTKPYPPEINAIMSFGKRCRPNGRKMKRKAATNIPMNTADLSFLEVCSTTG